MRERLPFYSALLVLTSFPSLCIQCFLTLRADTRLSSFVHDLVANPDTGATFIAEIHHIGYVYRSFLLNNPALAFGIRFFVSLDQINLLDDDPVSGDNRTQDFPRFPLFFTGDDLYGIPFFQSLSQHCLFL